MNAAGMAKVCRPNEIIIYATMSVSNFIHGSMKELRGAVTQFKLKEMYILILGNTKKYVIFQVKNFLEDSSRYFR